MTLCELTETLSRHHKGVSAAKLFSNQQTCLQPKIFMVTFAHFPGFRHFDFLQGVYLCGVPFASMNGL